MFFPHFYAHLQLKGRFLHQGSNPKTLPTVSASTVCMCMVANREGFCYHKENKAKE